MENLLKDIEVLNRDLKSKKEVLKNVVTGIKKEISEPYFKHSITDSTFFRFALMLLYGEYKHKHSINIVKDIKIKKATEWKTYEYSGYYHILKPNSWKYGFTEFYDIAGFICGKEKLATSLNRQTFHNLWKDQIIKGRCEIGLDDFVVNISLPENIEKLITMLKGSDLLDIVEVNYPSLKVRNILVCEYKTCQL